MTDATNPEVLLFASTTQSFLEKEASLSRLRELHAAGTAFDAGWWRRAAELGWTSLLVPEELGGGQVSGDGVKDLALVAELAGKTVAPGPLHPVSTVLAGLVEAPGNHEDTIESLVSGEVVASWAVYEPGRPWAPLEPGLTATPTDTGLPARRCEGSCRGGRRQCAASGGGGLRRRRAAVPGAADAPGVRVEAQRSIDLVKSYARVHFDGVEVDASAAVGTPEQTAELIARQSQIAQILQCAEVVGILDTVLELHHSVGLRPALVRPTARLVPGAQAQVRRPEDLVRGVQGDDQRRCRGGGEPLPRRRNGRQRREILCGRTRPAACCRTASSCTAASA